MQEFSDMITVNIKTELGQPWYMYQRARQCWCINQWGLGILSSTLSSTFTGFLKKKDACSDITSKRLRWCCGTGVLVGCPRYCLGAPPTFTNPNIKKNRGSRRHVTPTKCFIIILSLHLNSHEVEYHQSHRFLTCITSVASLKLLLLPRGKKKR